MIPDDLFDAIIERNSQITRARQMTIDSIIDGILSREGGYVDHLADPGGATNLGITARTLGAFRHLGRNATRAEVKALAETEARDIYAREYIFPFRFIPSPLNLLLIDWGVTTPRPIVIKALQTSLKHRGHYDAAIDGVIGRITRLGIATAPLNLVYADVLKARMAFYEEWAWDKYVQAFLKATPKTRLHFWRGHQRRCREFVVIE